MNLSPYAIEYAQQGLSVIPLVGKRPPETWTYYQSNIASKTQIDIWWNLYRDANVGIVTGSISNVFVIDFDHDAIRTFTSAHSIIKAHFGDGFVVSRTGKGFHCIVRTREAKMLRNTKIAKTSGGVLIETRGEGGYIVAPPSVHPDTGRQYQFTNGKRLTSIPFVSYDAIVATLTQLRKEFHQEPEEKLFDTSQDPSIQNGVMVVEDIDGYVGAIKRKIADRLANAVKGERNTELFKCAASLGTLGNYIEESEIYETLLTGCAASGYLGESKTEAIRTIRNGLKKAERIELKENPWMKLGITIGES
jgi:hypothetical protein